MDRAVAVAAAQRVVRSALGLVGLTIALNIVTAVLRSHAVGFFAELAGLLALTFSIVAVFRAADPLAYSIWLRIGLALLVAIPVANIVTLAVLDVRLRRATAG